MPHYRTLGPHPHPRRLRPYRHRVAVTHQVLHGRRRAAAIRLALRPLHGHRHRRVVATRRVHPHLTRRRLAPRRLRTAALLTLPRQARRVGAHPAVAGRQQRLRTTSWAERSSLPATCPSTMSWKKERHSMPLPTSNQHVSRRLPTAM